MNVLGFATIHPHVQDQYGCSSIIEGRTVFDITTDMLAPMELSYESPPVVIIPHMTKRMVVVFLAILCTMIFLVGLSMIIPWDYIWRPCHDYMSKRQANTNMKEKSIEALLKVDYIEKHILWMLTKVIPEFIEN